LALRICKRGLTPALAAAMSSWPMPSSAGEDVTNTAPSLALALAPICAPDTYTRRPAAGHIYEWQDAAIGRSSNGQQGPLIVARPAAPSWMRWQPRRFALRLMIWRSRLRRGSRVQLQIPPVVDLADECHTGLKTLPRSLKEGNKPLSSRAPAAKRGNDAGQPIGLGLCDDDRQPSYADCPPSAIAW